jgi:uncharacterized protein YcbX
MGSVGTIREIWRYPVKSMQGERLESCRVGSKGIPGDRGWALRDEVAGEVRGARAFPALLLCSARYREEPGDGPSPHVDIRLPGGEVIGSDDPSVSNRLSALLGRRVSLWPIRPASERDHYRRIQPEPTRFEEAVRELFSREPDEPLPDLSVFDPELFEFVSPLGTYFDAYPLHLLTTATIDALTRCNPRAAFDVRRFRPNFLIATGEEAEGLAELDWCGRTLRIGRMDAACAIPTPRCGMTTHPQPGLEKDPSILRTIVREAAQNSGIYASVASPGRVELGDEVKLLDEVAELRL